MSYDEAKAETFHVLLPDGVQQYNYWMDWKLETSVRYRPRLKYVRGKPMVYMRCTPFSRGTSFTLSQWWHELNEGYLLPC